MAIGTNVAESAVFFVVYSCLLGNTMISTIDPNVNNIKNPYKIIRFVILNFIILFFHLNQLYHYRKNRKNKKLEMTDNNPFSCLNNLTATELDQLQNINSISITLDQWTYISYTPLIYDFNNLNIQRQNDVNGNSQYEEDQERKECSRVS